MRNRVLTLHVQEIILFTCLHTMCKLTRKTLIKGVSFFILSVDNLRDIYHTVCGPHYIVKVQLTSLYLNYAHI